MNIKAAGFEKQYGENLPDAFTGKFTCGNNLDSHQEMRRLTPVYDNSEAEKIEPQRHNKRGKRVIKELFAKFNLKTKSNSESNSEFDAAFYSGINTGLNAGLSSDLHSELHSKLNSISNLYFKINSKSKILLNSLLLCVAGTTVERVNKACDNRRAWVHSTAFAWRSCIKEAVAQL